MTSWIALQWVNECSFDGSLNWSFNGSLNGPWMALLWPDPLNGPFSGPFNCPTNTNKLSAHQVSLWNDPMESDMDSCLPLKLSHRISSIAGTVAEAGRTWTDSRQSSDAAAARLCSIKLLSEKMRRTRLPEMSWLDWRQIPACKPGHTSEQCKPGHTSEQCKPGHTSEQCKPGHTREQCNPGHMSEQCKPLKPGHMSDTFWLVCVHVYIHSICNTYSISCRSGPD